MSEIDVTDPNPLAAGLAAVLGRETADPKERAALQDFRATVLDRWIEELRRQPIPPEGLKP